MVSGEGSSPDELDRLVEIATELRGKVPRVLASLYPPVDPGWIPRTWEEA
jgi:hypothetical protein